MTIHSSAVPVITRNATAPWVRAVNTPETCMIRALGSRSAITPPKRRKTTIGMVWAARTRPSAVAESVISNTAKARATEPSISANRAA